MTPEQLAVTVGKVIDLSKDDAVLNMVYFNPAFTNQLSRKAPDLNNLGFRLSQTETETKVGTLISAAIIAPNGSTLDLGSVLLDGKQLVIEDALTTIHKLTKFIVQEATGLSTKAAKTEPFSVYDRQTIQLPGGRSIYTFATDDDQGMIVGNKDNPHTIIYQQSDGTFRLDTNKWDEEFNTLKDLVKYLNDNGFEYVGVDDRY